MIRDVKVERVSISSLHNSFEWSEDGLFAITNTENVIILNPQNPTFEAITAAGTSSSNNAKLDEKYEVQVSQALAFTKPLGEAPVTSFNIETYCSDDYCIGIAWSPSGTSSSRKCLLSVLTNQGDIIIYDYNVKSTSSKWTRIISCITSLKQKLENDPAYLVPAEQTRDYIFNSMAWSPRFPANVVEYDKWGSAFFAVGTKSGKVVIFEPVHTYNQETRQYDTLLDIIHAVEFTNQLFDQHIGINKLKWSSWIKGPLNKYYSLLIGVTPSNEVVSKLITYDSETKSLDIFSSLSVIQQPSRFLITSLWIHYHKKTNQFLVAVTQSVGISVYIINDINKPLTPKRLFYKTPPQKQPISLISLMPRDEYSVWVIGFADWVDSFIGTINLATPPSTIEPGFPSDSPVSNPLDAFFERRINAMNDAENHTGAIGEPTSTFQFRFYGVAPHPFGGGYFAFLNTLMTENQVRYILTFSTRFQVSFQPMCIEEYGSMGKKRMGPPEPAQLVATLPDATQGSPESIWWKVKALSSSVRTAKQRPLYIKKMIEELENYASDHHGEALFKANPIDSDVEMVNHKAFEKALHADLTKTFFLTKFYDVLRLLIHLKNLALQMQQVQTQMREKELTNLAENSYTAGLSHTDIMEENIFGEDISRFESDVEKHTQVIVDELCFVVLCHVAGQGHGTIKPGSGGLSNVERAVVESYIVQLEKDQQKQEQEGLDEITTQNNRFNRSFVNSVIAKCRKMIKKDEQEDGLVLIPGDGFTEHFDFKTQNDASQILSKRGYPWKRCTITLLPLTYFCTKVCGGCGRQIAVLSSYEDDKDSQLLGVLLGESTFDICVYCGCRYSET